MWLICLSAWGMFVPSRTMWLKFSTVWDLSVPSKRWNMADISHSLGSFCALKYEVADISHSLRSVSLSAKWLIFLSLWGLSLISREMSGVCLRYGACLYRQLQHSQCFSQLQYWLHGKCPGSVYGMEPVYTVSCNTAISFDTCNTASFFFLTVATWEMSGVWGLTVW